jgi:hypothetical protein
MSGFAVLQSIVEQLVTLETAPYLVGVLALGVGAFLWGRDRHTQSQRRVIAASIALWACIPASIMVAAIFHYSGPNDLRGVSYNEAAAVAVASIAAIAAFGSIALLAIGNGVRFNLAASGAGLVFAQFWVWLVSGCAVVGVCT